MKKYLFSLVSILFLVFVSSANASSGVYGGYGAPCQPVYGGGEVCISKGNILVNKTVQNPQTGAFVDNLSLSNDPRFGAEKSVTFQLTITNTGSVDFSEVTVTDVFPSYLDFVSGPGSYNQPNKTLTFKIQDLAAEEAEVFNLVAKVTSEGNLPKDQAVVCVINQVKAVSADNESNDLSQVCIEKVITVTKGGLPVLPAPVIKETPPTGPGLLSLIGLIPAALGGFYLRRKASR